VTRNRMFTGGLVFNCPAIGYNKESLLEVSAMSTAFWIVMIVMLLMIVPILTAGYNDDKTKGL